MNHLGLTEEQTDLMKGVSFKSLTAINKDWQLSHSIAQANADGSLIDAMANHNPYTILASLYMHLDDVGHAGNLEDDEHGELIAKILRLAVRAARKEGAN